MLDPEVEARPWDEQVALDDAAYRAQLGYLLERSTFYRRKLGAAGVDAAQDAGGLAEIGQLPLTEKHELRETVTPDDPIGAHCCAARAEIVRIYSTSGTTGTPSYVPLTAGDLENWIAGSARSYAASGVSGGRADRLDLQRRPLRGGRGARLVRPHRALPRPRRHGEHRSARPGDRAAAPGGRGADAVVRRATSSSGRPSAASRSRARA